MDAQNNTKDDEINIQGEALTDLPVTDEQADGVRAGGAPGGRLFLGTEVGVFVS